MTRSADQDASARRGRVGPALTIAVVLLAVASSGCSNGTTTTAAPATTASGGVSGAIPVTSAGAAGASTVVIKDFTFSPVPITVKSGQTITFTNEDTAPHEPTFGMPGYADKVFDVETEAGKSGTTGPITKPPGTYPYFCAIHEYMTGKIIVQ